MDTVVSQLGIFTVRISEDGSNFKDRGHVDLLYMDPVVDMAGLCRFYMVIVCELLGKL